MQPQAQNPSPEAPKPDSQERLPKPIIPEAEQSLEGAPEAAPVEAGESPRGDGANQNAGMPIGPVPQPVTQDEPDDQTQTTATEQIDTPPVAGDDHLIEKEWVKKAKEVVDNTRDDPKKQSDGIEMVKTDYVKKRFGKEIPQEADQVKG